MPTASPNSVERNHLNNMYMTVHFTGLLAKFDMYIARRQTRWLGHVSRMPFERLPRRMLSSWVPHRRPVGAPTMTYGRSVFKALDKFNLDVERWPELAADRNAWRAMLKTGIAPPAFRPAPSPPPPEPIARTKPTRCAAAATNARIDGARAADVALLARIMR